MHSGISMVEKDTECDASKCLLNIMLYTGWPENDHAGHECYVGKQGLHPVRISIDSPELILQWSDDYW